MAKQQEQTTAKDTGKSFRASGRLEDGRAFTGVFFAADVNKARRDALTAIEPLHWSELRVFPIEVAKSDNPEVELHGPFTITSPRKRTKKTPAAAAGPDGKPIGENQTLALNSDGRTEVVDRPVAGAR
jgi:hypothetical protein